MPFVQLPNRKNDSAFITTAQKKSYKNDPFSLFSRRNGMPGIRTPSALSRLLPGKKSKRRDRPGVFPKEATARDLRRGHNAFP